ncbi:major facilitator superfamily domain-containing protein [Syncephalis plumigaleata]|nr:major facilitator superfamily domain-containing protein [Syncephalis plumigaleata]
MSEHYQQHDTANASLQVPRPRETNPRRSRRSSRNYEYYGAVDPYVRASTATQLSIYSEIPGLRGWYERTRRSRTALMFLVSLVLFNDMLIYGVPVLPLIVRERLGGDAKSIGLLFGSAAIGILLATPIFGILSDRYRTRRRPMMVALLCCAIATLCFAFAATFWQLLLARILQGIAGGASWTISLSMVADAFPAHQLGVAMSSVLVWNSFGFLAGPAIGGFLFEYGGYMMPFLFCAIGAFITLLVSSVVIPPVLGEDTACLVSDELLAPSIGPSYYESGEARRLSTASEMYAESLVDHDVEDGLARGYWEADSEFALSRISLNSHVCTPLTFLGLMCDKAIIVDCITIMVASSVFSGIEPTLPLHLIDRFELDPSLVGLLFMVIVLPHMIATPVVGWLCDRVSCKAVAAIGMLLFALASPPIALPSQLNTEIICLAVFGLTAAIAMTPILPDMANQVTARGGGAYAQVFALWNMAYSLGMLIGPILSGIIMVQYGFLYNMVIFAVMLLFIAPFIVQMEAKSRQRVEDERRMSYGEVMDV